MRMVRQENRFPGEVMQSLLEGVQDPAGKSSDQSGLITVESWIRDLLKFQPEVFYDPVILLSICRHPVALSSSLQ